jgi:NAD(P)-dependent dehydrogenase (short-subunit alcohol dehydrogenase family)
MTKTQTFIITGGTSGMGLELVRRLGRDPSNTLIVGARSPHTAHALRASVPVARLFDLPLDLEDLTSVRSFANAVIAKLRPADLIDGIACNAGLQLVGPLEKNDEGVEKTFAANHLGHFVLVHALLPHLSPGAVVVSTASGTHLPGDKVSGMFGFRGAIFPSADAVSRGQLDADASVMQQGMDRYATSKLCNILFTFEMARRVPLTDARFLAFDPGLMPGTGLARGRSSFDRFGWAYLLPVLRFAMKGVSTPVRSATALAALLTGMSYAERTAVYVDFTLAATPASSDAMREDLARDLYDISARLGRVTGLPEPTAARLFG